MLLGTGASWNLETEEREREKEGRVCIEKWYAH